MTPFLPILFCFSALIVTCRALPSLSIPFFSSHKVSVSSPQFSDISEEFTDNSSSSSSDTSECMNSSQEHYLSDMDTSAPSMSHQDNQPVLDQDKVSQTVDWSQLIRVAASGGDLRKVQQLHEQGGSKVEHLNDADSNGWQAIHEAARSGEVELVEYLFNHGAEIGHLTHGGGSVLFWAKTFQDDSCIGYLEGIGAPDQRDERFDRSGEKQGGGGEEEEGDRDFHILITTTDL